MAQDQAPFAHITTNATTVLRGTATGGILKRIVINTAGSAWTATIYDNTAGSGDVIAVVSLNAQNSLEYELQYTRGLTIVTSGTTPGDLTVVYT
jgi:hypothetical protein